MDASHKAITSYFDSLERVFTDGALVINLDEQGIKTGLTQGRRRRLSRAIFRVVLVSRGTGSGTQELFENGFTPDSTIYEDQDNGFIDSELFAEWREDATHLTKWLGSPSRTVFGHQFHPIDRSIQLHL
jgi:hypothetical protein